MGVRRIMGFRILFITTLIAVMLPASGVQGGEVELFLAHRVEIPSPEILLGDLARITSTDRSLAERLRSVSLGNAPLPGQSISIGADYIGVRLRQQRLDPEAFTISGSEKVTVTRECREIGKEEIADAVRSYIEANAPWEPARMTITGIDISGSVTVPAGDVSINVQAPTRKDYLGRVPFPVVVDGEGGYRRKLWATASIEVTADVVVSLRPINRYKRIEEDDVGVRRMNLADVSSSSIKDIDEVFDKRAKRRIRPNEVLTSDMVEFPPLVKRGDRIYILAESPGLRVTTLGEARQDGALGEKIRVVNLDSKKTLYGSVLDGSTVKVDF
jgi:flagellar basal body P-ring formation protein FlgA